MFKKIILCLALIVLSCISNLPPMANIGVMGADKVPALKEFIIEAKDPDGVVVKYELDFEGDGIYDTATSDSTASYLYKKPGTYNTKIRITDNDGATMETNITLKILPSNVVPIIIRVKVINKVETI